MDPVNEAIGRIRSDLQNMQHIHRVLSQNCDYDHPRLADLDLVEQELEVLRRAMEEMAEQLIRKDNLSQHSPHTKSEEERRERINDYIFAALELARKELEKEESNATI